MINLTLVATVFAANCAINRFGIVSVGFDLHAPAAVYFAGLAFSLRDLDIAAGEWAAPTNATPADAAEIEAAFAACAFDELSALGRSLAEAVAVIREWAYGNVEHITGARDHNYSRDAPRSRRP